MEPVVDALQAAQPQLPADILYGQGSFCPSGRGYSGLSASCLFSAFLAKGTDGVMKIEVLSLFLLFSIPDIFFLQGRHTTEHVEVSGGAV